MSGRAVRLQAVVRGRVQGVGYRAFVLDRARSAGLTGWVANRDDGTVELVAEGPAETIDRLLLDLREGPPAARVDAVVELRSAASGTFDRFRVVPGGHTGD